MENDDSDQAIVVFLPINVKIAFNYVRCRPPVIVRIFDQPYYNIMHNFVDHLNPILQFS